MMPRAPRDLSSCCVVQGAFSASATGLKRLDAITKSPVLTLFGQTLDGLATIRPMEVSGSLEAAMSAAIDTNTAAYLAWAHLNR